jgi:hypothetical protein
MWWHPACYSRHLPFTLIPQNPGQHLSTRITPLLHCGNSVLPGTFQDRGVEAALRSTERLRDWVQMIAREALDQEKLPAIQHPALTLDRLRSLWPAGVFPAAQAKLEEWTGYPWNGLFPHPLNGATPVVVRKLNAA